MRRSCSKPARSIPASIPGDRVEHAFGVEEIPAGRIALATSHGTTMKKTPPALFGPHKTLFEEAGGV